MKCLVCQDPQTDKCHIKSKGSGGTSDDWNIMNLCRLHHVEQHKIGIITFIKKYSEVQNDLALKGWVIVNEFNKERLRRK